jgi:hypothetical protein
MSCPATQEIAWMNWNCSSFDGVALLELARLQGWTLKPAKSRQ